MVANGKKFWQEVQYEKHGFYYSKCCRQSHTVVICQVDQKTMEKGKSETCPNRRQVWKEKSAIDKDGQVVEGLMEEVNKQSKGI